MEDADHRATNNIRAKAWQKANRARRRKYFAVKRSTDVRYRISHLMAVAINRIVKKTRKTDRWFTLLGYTVKALEARLLETMPAGATWADFMAGRLHIDHIRDKVLFQYDTPEHPEFKAAWALSNLRLLWAIDNLNRPKHTHKRRLTLVAARA